MKPTRKTRRRLERSKVVKVEPLHGSMQQPPKVHMHSSTQPPEATCAACRGTGKETQ
jgi:hypothetical protein